MNWKPRHSWFVLVSAHENLHETDPRFEVRLTNDWFVFVFVVELAWFEKTTQFLALFLLTLSSFAAEIIFSCYKVWLDLNSSFHRTKVGLKGYPIPIPQHLIKILASPLRKKKTWLTYVYVYVRICIGCKCGLWWRWKLRVGTRETRKTCQLEKHINDWVLLVGTWRHSSHVGGVFGHFSHLGTKPYFHVNFSRKKLYCIDHQHTTDMAALSIGIIIFQKIALHYSYHTCSQKKNIYHIVTEEKKHFKLLPHYI